jgi:hypothetical protein
MMTNWSEDIFSRNPLEKTFGDKRGKLFHYVLCWKLHNGEQSQWSPVKSCFVP